MRRDWNLVVNGCGPNRYLQWPESVTNPFIPRNVGPANACVEWSSISGAFVELFTPFAPIETRCDHGD